MENLKHLMIIKPSKRAMNKINPLNCINSLRVKLEDHLSNLILKINFSAVHLKLLTRTCFSKNIQNLITFLEIGGGFGTWENFISIRNKGLKYINIDIPQSLYYLSTTLLKILELRMLIVIFKIEK